MYNSLVKDNITLGGARVDCVCSSTWSQPWNRNSKRWKRKWTGMYFEMLQTIQLILLFCSCAVNIVNINWFWNEIKQIWNFTILSLTTVVLIGEFWLFTKKTHNIVIDNYMLTTVETSTNSLNIWSLSIRNFDFRSNVQSVIKTFSL